MARHISTLTINNIDADVMEQCMDSFTLADDYALVQGLSFKNNPYTRSRMLMMREARMWFILSGEARLEINLTVYRFAQGMIVLLPTDTLVCIKSASDDFRLSGTVFKSNIPVHDIVTLTQDDDRYGDAISIYNTLHTYCQHHYGSEHVVELLQRALLEHLLAIHAQISVGHEGVMPKTRNEELFHRFKLLVSHHAHTERRVAFYAEKLCISPHHLMSVVQRISGQSVLHWIEHSAILYAKVTLSTTDKSLQQLSMDMNFPSSTAFSRWFRRIENLSPRDYRAHTIHSS